jgi:short-subunit dehydrogenase
MRRFFVSLSILLSLAPLAYSAATPDQKNMKAVLVTGASTGIGRKITERLAADGNIGSINGIVSFAQTSAYSMSKHSIEAFTDALALEMAPLGVQVSVVEPGSYKSDIFKNEVQRSGTGGQVLQRVSHAKDPDEVAAAVEQALFEPNPKHRYMVVPDEQQARFTITAQIEKLVELNERQPYAYDRDTLVKMLDEALTRTRPQGK